MQLVYHIAEPQLDACGNQVYNHAWVSWLARAEVADIHAWMHAAIHRCVAHFLHGAIALLMPA